MNIINADGKVVGTLKSDGSIITSDNGLSEIKEDISSADGIFVLYAIDDVGPIKKDTIVDTGELIPIGSANYVDAVMWLLDRNGYTVKD